MKAVCVPFVLLLMFHLSQGLHTVLMIALNHNIIVACAYVFVR